MKTILRGGPVALFALLFIVACNKDESTEGNGGNKPQLSTSFIKCSIDGVAKTFNYNAAASKQDLGGGTISYSVFGKATATSGDYTSFGFSIQVPGALTGGTYTEIDSTASIYLAGVYNPNTSDPSKIFASQMDSLTPFELTVNEISDSIMAGTFKGKMRLNTAEGDSSITITGGDFKVKVQ